ncbi:MAG: hypothetical protein IJG24_02770 [Selenomonadaceae bacterium]|nr:hypothetical protein [Selenomonadaceae bacterium]
MIQDYHLQSVLQRHIETEAPRHYTISLHSLSQCCKHPLQDPNQTSSGGVHVITHGKARRGAFLGLQMCGNSWSCPVCAPIRIAEKRIRVTKLLERAKEAGYVGIMVTFTIPHTIRQPAAEVLKNLHEAKHLYDLWFSNRKFLSTATRAKRYDVAGSICACECKYSYSRGFHFHYHVVYVVRAKDEQKFRADEPIFRRKWQSLTERYKPNYYAYKTEPDGLHISEQLITNGNYIAKELCKTSNGKRGRSMEMFELLQTDDPRDKDIFIEFAAAVRGYARVRCSSRLRQNLAISAEELKAQIVGEFDFTAPKVVATFTFDAWYEICRDECDTRKLHRRWILLRAQLDGFDGVYNYCLENALPVPMKPYIEFVEISSGVAASSNNNQAFLA